MIAIIYQWRLHEDKRDQFTEAWAAITEGLKAHGALGSALFKAADGSVFAIARWPDLATREAAFGKANDPALYARMADAIAEKLHEQVLDEQINLWS